MLIIRFYGKKVTESIVNCKNCYFYAGVLLHCRTSKRGLPHRQTSHHTFNYLTAIASISSNTPFGSLATSTQERAGHSFTKYLE